METKDATLGQNAVEVIMNGGVTNMDLVIWNQSPTERDPEAGDWPSAMEVWKVTYQKPNGTWSIPTGEEILVTVCKLWRQVGETFRPSKTCTTVSWSFRIFYEKVLLEYEKHKVLTGQLQIPLSAIPQPGGTDREIGVNQSSSARVRRDAAIVGVVFFGLFGSVMFTLVYVDANVPQIVLDGLLEIHDIVMFISCINFCFE